MSQFTGTRCDVCKKVKDTANKWLKATLYPGPMDSTVPGIFIGVEGELDLCSDVCMQKLLGEKLAEIRAQGEPVRGSSKLAIDWNNRFDSDFHP